MTEAAEPGVFAAVSAYVSGVFGGGAERVGAVDRFPDGNRHAVYRVAYLLSGGAQSRVVVRISLDGTAGEVSQAQREARVLEHLQGVGAPRLHDFRTTSPWFAAPVMCMEFLHGDRRDLGSCTAAEVEQLGSLLGSLHRQPAGDLAESLRAAADVASYAQDRWESILAGF